MTEHPSQQSRSPWYRVKGPSFLFSNLVSWLNIILAIGWGVVTMKKLFWPIISLCRWVAGLPPGNPPGATKRWFFRILSVAFVGLIGWFLFLGPGVVLMPFAPKGFRLIADSTDSVYYQKGEAAAREVLRLAGEAQNSILDFWGATDSIELLKASRYFWVRRRKPITV